MKKTSTKSATRGRPKDTAKRDGIVRAASDLFFKDGYELTSMEAIARKADVSKLTIYSHFANKDELFREVVWQRCDQRALSFMTMINEDVEKSLTKIATDLAELVFSRESVCMHRIIQAEASRHPKVVRIFYDAGPKRVRAAFGDLLGVWQKQGRVKIADIPRATEQFFSLLKGEPLTKTLMMLAPSPDAAEIKKHVRATVALFLAGYQSRSSKVVR